MLFLYARWKIVHFVGFVYVKGFVSNVVGLVNFLFLCSLIGDDGPAVSTVGAGVGFGYIGRKDQFEKLPFLNCFWPVFHGL